VTRVPCLPVFPRQLKCKRVFYALDDEITCFDRLVPCAFASPSGRYCCGAVRLRNVIWCGDMRLICVCFLTRKLFVVPCTVEVFSSNLVVQVAEASYRQATIRW
jgi:hypothetical protein